MQISHDWDTEDYVQSLNDAYDTYKRACYGDGLLPDRQFVETKQAFLSGIHWLASRDSYCPEDLDRALRKILGKHNPLVRDLDSEGPS